MSTIDGEIIAKILCFVFAAGVVWAKLEAIQKDISRLEEKQDKYNNLQERTHILEVKVDRLEKKG